MVERQIFRLTMSAAELLNLLSRGLRWVKASEIPEHTELVGVEIHDGQATLLLHHPEYGLEGEIAASTIEELSPDVLPTELLLSR